MAGPSEREKDEARGDATFFERFANAAGGAFAAVTAVQQMTAPGVPDPFTAGTLGAIALLGVLGKDQQIVTRTIAEDPPRRDFNRRTGLRPIGLRESVLRESPYGIVFTKAAQELSRANIRLEAALRAHERSLGAAEAEQLSIAHARNDEARHWSHRAGERLEGFSELARQLAEGFDEQSGRWTVPPGETVGGSTETLESLLDPFALAWLFRLGVPVKALSYKIRVTQVGVRPMADFASQVAAAGEQSQAFGRFLIEV